MSRLLLTGATGFVGRHVLLALRGDAGFAVHAVTTRRPPTDAPEVRWHVADLLRPADVAPLLAAVRPTHWLHLAWVAEPRIYLESPENERWRAASEALLFAFREAGGRRAVAVGSCLEYARSDRPCHETSTPSAPNTPYGFAKQAFGEALLREGGGLRPAWARLFHLYGPHERPPRLLPHVVTSLLRSERALCTAGTQVRDFLYVEDAAQALVRLLRSDVVGPVNVASGVPVRVRDVVAAAARAIGREDLVSFGDLPLRPDEAPYLVADTRRLADEVGWRPSVALEEGVERTVAWWRAELGTGRAR